MNPARQISWKKSIFGDFIFLPDGIMNEKHKRSFLTTIITAPLFFAWEVTRRCNFKCLHCLNNCSISQENEMNSQEALMIADQIVGVSPFNVCLCGGEPLLRKDIFDILSRLNLKGGIYLSMVTNGWFLSLEVAQQLKKAGLSAIQISIDGAKSQTHDSFRGKTGAFDKAIRAVKNSVDSGLAVSIAFSPTKLNIDEFPLLIDLLVCLEIPELRMRVQPLMPMGRCIENETKVMPSSDDYLRLIWMILKKRVELRDKNVMFEWGDPLDHIYTLGEANQFFPFMEIDANGKIRLSPYLPITVGDLKKHTVKEYWNSNFFKMWRHPTVKKLSTKLRTLEGMKTLSPRPYFEPDIYLEAIKK